jgi:hypothetical protein
LKKQCRYNQEDPDENHRGINASVPVNVKPLHVCYEPSPESDRHRHDDKNAKYFLRKRDARIQSSQKSKRKMPGHSFADRFNDRTDERQESPKDCKMHQSRERFPEQFCLQQRNLYHSLHPQQRTVKPVFRFADLQIRK